MRRSHRAFTIACTFGPALIASSASAQRPHPHNHPDVVVDAVSSRSDWRSSRADSLPNGAAGQISTTANSQILVELAPDDTAPANLFDLNGRTLVFTPDGNGGYSRAVQSVAWEDHAGEAVVDREEIELPGFQFDFAGRKWGSFFVSGQGLLTFGAPLAYNYRYVGRFAAMREIAGEFVDAPTISPLYKPLLDKWGGTGEVTVARFADRIVVTWVTRESEYYVAGDAPVRFQVVLGADGSIGFNYAHVPFRDGVVGLFSAADLARGRLLASIVDGADSDLPGHLDLLDAAIYATNAGSAVILEFTLRAPIPDPGAGEFYSYRLHLDTDEPYWNHPLDWLDEDATWQIDVREGGEYTARGKGVRQFLTGKGEARISLLADAAVLAGDGPRVSAMAVAGAAHFRDDEWVQGDYDSRALLGFPAAGAQGVDLSAPDSLFSHDPSEVFHYRSPPDPLAIACRVIEILGDGFDVFVFHGEFRVDSQESGTPVRPHYGNTRAEGTGVPWNFGVPCGEGRLKAVWALPVWMRSFNVYAASAPEDRRFDAGLLLFAHEFTHAWTAHASYERHGQREPLFDQLCRCHWRPDLHVPAAFPWNRSSPGPGGLMSALIEEGGGAGRLGGFWRENPDGTFTPITDYADGGHSWLDLYMMGLAEAGEVPDMFILRNLQPVRGGDRYTAERETVSIEQVVAAEGPRRPSARHAQKDFNAAFVYLLEPGRTPDADLLRLHADYRAKVIEHWSHVTGGRSRMTTTVPGIPNRSPAAVGTLADLTLHVGGTPAVVDVADAFRDPDGDPLTYRAASSAPAVATAVVAGSRATLTPVAVGMTTVTVTASDTGGSSATQRFAVSVTAPSTFTDHPIRPGTTPIRAVHFRELRERIAALRTRWSLPAVAWTDPILTAGVTPVRLAHLLELRSALAEAYAWAGQAAPRWSDTAPAAGTTPIRAAHLMELRAAVVELE